MGHHITVYSSCGSTDGPNSFFAVKATNMHLLDPSILFFLAVSSSPKHPCSRYLPNPPPPHISKTTEFLQTQTKSVEQPDSNSSISNARSVIHLSIKLPTDPHFTDDHIFFLNGVRIRHRIWPRLYDLFANTSGGLKMIPWTGPLEPRIGCFLSIDGDALRLLPVRFINESMDEETSIRGSALTHWWWSVQYILRTTIVTTLHILVSASTLRTSKRFLEQFSVFSADGFYWDFFIKAALRLRYRETTCRHCGHFHTIFGGGGEGGNFRNGDERVGGFWFLAWEVGDVLLLGWSFEGT